MKRNKKKVLHQANRCLIRTVLPTIIFILAATGPALAHKFLASGWVEGDTVVLEAAFGNGDIPHNAEVLVLDDAGTLLLSTTTDDEGICSFTIPQKSALHIKVKAGMGHQAKILIPLEEVAAAFPAKDTPAASAALPSTEADRTAPADSQMVSGLSAQGIQAIVEKSLDNKLRPIIRKLSVKENTGPNVKDIAGGIGYIFGLVGIGTYFNYRRRKKA
ncbi:hypothetical protein [Desulfosarcina ovata]|uniref:Nickel transport protein n=1 Tax=Desulfosarcina ovata subsp. ovata TaxID=2752305 RepID=A0A5K8ACI8_9BACT|nr:hypothetical protein [Desulfosarcina ovata]BBO89650.1 hypothetical protein DSCOOX_28300 [Desulfosarcina ovata subsp. ovata]